MTYQPPWWTCLDGMSIKALDEYCPEIDKGRVFGTVDYGDKMTMGEVDDKTPANEALVCMLTGIRGNWKMPLVTYQPPWWTCLDGMSIKALDEYCPEIDKGRVFGTVDYGDKMTMGEVDDKTPANEALVCMLTGIRGNWKIPIAYFLVKGTKAGIQSGIIRESILAAFDVGINVLNVTMDGTSHNITA